MKNWYNEAGPDQDVVISCRIRMARNFANIPFPYMADEKACAQVLAIADDAASQSGIDGATLLSINSLPMIEREYLVETHIISKELAEKTTPAGLIISNTPLSVMVNEEDHFRIQSILPGLQMQEAYNNCLKFERLPILQKMFAFSREFGYLTGCPTNTGTGIRASAMLHLPALVLDEQIDTILESCSKANIAVRGIYGENSKSIANMFQFSNQITLGQSESDIINGITSVVFQMCALERRSRDLLASSEKVLFKDRIYRALGILTHARTISSDEALSLLSDVKMGLDLNILKGMTVQEIITLMTNVQPATLQKLSGKVLPSEERDIERADMIRNLLQQCEGER